MQSLKEPFIKNIDSDLKKLQKYDPPLVKKEGNKYINNGLVELYDSMSISATYNAKEKGIKNIYTFRK